MKDYAMTHTTKLVLLKPNSLEAKRMVAIARAKELGIYILTNSNFKPNWKSDPKMTDVAATFKRVNQQIDELTLEGWR